MQAFYRDVLGLSPIDEDPIPRSTSRASTGRPSMPAACGWSSSGTPEVEPVERDRVSVVPAFRVEGLDGVVERLQARGVVFTERGREAWGAYANLHDPDGNLLNLYEPDT